MGRTDFLLGVIRDAERRRNHITHHTPDRRPNPGEPKVRVDRRTARSSRRDARLRPQRPRHLKAGDYRGTKRLARFHRAKK